MRLNKIGKKMITGMLVTALAVSAVTGVQNAKAEEMEVPFAQNEDGTYHENSFELARVADDDSLSSYEEGNGKHWIKLFSVFDGTKNIFDQEELPDDTAKVKVVFDITGYDLDQAYPLTWATGIGGWASGKPTGVTIDQDGTYEAVLDFASETDGIGRAISAADINTASVQLVFQLGESDQEGIANIKKTKVTFKACYAYEESDEVIAAPVAPIIEDTPAPAPTAASDATSAPEPTVSPDGNGPAGNTDTPAVSAAAVPDDKTDAGEKTTAVKTNKVKKLKAAKKKVTIKKGKTKTITFQVTTAVKSRKTTDKITKAKVSDKKIARVTKKSLGKKKCSIKVKGLKKGKTTLTVQVGSKKAKVKVKVV
ncbi:MAG: hypothetical protein Q4D32_00310 [Eubacteriales bacterium]|nr:hypothetical protein [Eubacteriales bacterium]